MNPYNYFNSGNKSKSNFHTIETKSMTKRVRFNNRILMNHLLNINPIIKKDDSQFNILKSLTKNNKKQLSTISLNSYKSSNSPTYYRNLYYNLNCQSNELPYITNKYYNINNDSISSYSINNNFSLSSSRNKKKRNLINFSNPSKSVDIGKNNIKNVEKLGKSSKSTTKIFGKSIYQNKDNFFNVYKVVKDIKKCVANREIYNGNKDDNNFHDIAFLKKHEDVVYDAYKILNKFSLKNQVTLEKSESSVNTFLTQNKQVFIKNYLIKLINSESNKIYSNTESREKQLKESKKSLEVNEQNFDSFTEVQKIACKQIDSMLSKLKIKNGSLSEEERNKIADLKILQEEIKKTLIQIDKLRIFGKFVNSVLGGDTTRFEHSILPHYFYHNDLDNYDEILKNVFEKYDCFINNTNENDPKFQREKLIMDNPGNLSHKFREIESNIIRMLKIEEDTENSVKEKEDENKNLNNLKEKCMILQNEYDCLNEKYEQELKKYYEIKLKEDNVEANNFRKMIIELFLYVDQNLKNISSKNNKNKNNNNNVINNIKKISMFDSINNLQKILYEKEKLVDDLMAKLSNYEKDDPVVFLEAINYNKLAERNLKKSNKIKKLHVKSGGNEGYGDLNKIIFISRKTEPPFYIPKKKEKKIYIDKNILKQKENEELIQYADE